MFNNFSLNKARRKAVASVAAVVAAGVAVTGAIFYPGFATADVDLNDGGVWVTNRSTGQIGHINYASRTLDAGLLATSSDFDITQESATVFMSNGDDGSQAPIDVANVTLGQAAGLPARAQLLLGTEHAAVVDSLRGKIWAMGAGAVASFAAEDQDPLLQDIKGAIAAVGRDDTIHVADPGSEQLLSYTPQADGTYRETAKERLPGLAQAKAPQITALGDSAVVLDPEAGRLYLPGGRIAELPNARDAVLQQSGSAAKAVAVAVPEALIKVPLDGGEAVSIASGQAGAPAAPVQLDGCIHAAWSGSGQYIRDCEDDAGDQQTAVPSLEAQAELQFRVNRRVVVLNDLSGGNIWLVNDGMQIINNWEDLKPPPGDDDKKSNEQSNEISPVTELPDRTEENTPPVAVNDDFGVRPGRTTVLPVIYNDSDSDGDLLTAAVEGTQPTIGTVQGIYNGTGLQIVVPPDASGTASFRYTVNDGRGGEDTASVRLRVVAPDSNQPPVQERETVINMEQGRSISHNVLTDWSDPDGDDLQLTAARVTSGQDLVRIRPDGLLTFQDVGVSIGRKEVSVTVSDGRDRTTAKMLFEVKPRGLLKPVANPDHVMVAAGEDIAIAPLKNDQDPAGGTLRLAQAQEVPGAVVRPNIEAGTVNFRSEKPGTYYVTYLVTNGPSSASSLIRVDVIDADAENGAPVAVRDMALLPAGGEALVDVLANDSDPAGGVLVVQSVSAPRDTAVTLSVVNHSVVRVSDTRGLAEPTSFTYVVSNGTESSTGEVSVVPVPAPPKLQPPRANPDEATVRVNDVVNIPVLANDEHPNGASLALNPSLVETVEPAEGLMAVSGDQLRFKAGTKAGTVNAVYSVVGPDGQEASAQVTIHVRPWTVRRTPTPYRAM